MPDSHGRQLRWWTRRRSQRGRNATNAPQIETRQSMSAGTDRQPTVHVVSERHATCSPDEVQPCAVRMIFPPLQIHRALLARHTKGAEHIRRHRRREGPSVDLRQSHGELRGHSGRCSRPPRSERHIVCQPSWRSRRAHEVYAAQPPAFAFASGLATCRGPVCSTPVDRSRFGHEHPSFGGLAQRDTARQQEYAPPPPTRRSTLDSLHRFRERRAKRSRGDEPASQRQL